MLRPFSSHRLVAFAILLLFAWACAGGVLWQFARTIHYRWVRCTAAAGAENDTIIVVTPSSRVEWMEDDEVRYEGRMFDVRHHTKKGDTGVLTGHFDTGDDNLFAFLRNFLDPDAGADDRPAGEVPVFLYEALPPVYWTYTLRAGTPRRCVYMPWPARGVPRPLLLVPEVPPDSWIA